MALKHFGFIVTGAGMDPARHRSEMTSGAFRMLTVGVARPEQALPVAAGMVADGIELIELCGGFGPVWTGKVIEHIQGRVPVGAVAYGPEATGQLHALFS